MSLSDVIFLQAYYEHNEYNHLSHVKAHTPRKDTLNSTG